ncbi:hypothetical protein AXX12_13935 [Anaerosporomusa subterranea]|uniref:Uncharacterized protein n=1 Tax=Anaerosporomusa subterranea TaxID=1794912 RepID=A0A154BMZ7_ANASB|nr:hypothetical protein [Anaerosporomusa subterranea]KYZ75255.1 hypothetical protein AXX12_13935 [Anaerosporomusa subterranea]
MDTKTARLGKSDKVNCSTGRGNCLGCGKFPCDCCNPNIIDLANCFTQIKNVTKCVLDCLDERPSLCKEERVAVCILLNEIRSIEDFINNSTFGLPEIKNEIRFLESFINNTIFGLPEIKNEIIEINITSTAILNEVIIINEVVNAIKNTCNFCEFLTNINEVVIDINNTVNNGTKGIFEIKNEIIDINEIVTTINNTINNGTSGLPEIKNEIIDINRIVTAINNTVNNGTKGVFEIKNEIIDLNEIITTINNTIHNGTSGLPEIKNEIIDINRIVTAINSTVNNGTKGVFEIKNEIIDLNEIITTINNTIHNGTFGLPEIKNEIIDINRIVTAINSSVNNQFFGLNEIKNEIRGIENILMTSGPNRSLSCSNDSILICGRGVDDVIRTIKTDVHNVTATLPSASTHSQIGALFSLVTSLFVQGNSANFLFLFSNPSSKTMYLDKIMVGSQVSPSATPLNYVESIRIRIIKNSIISDPGTPLFPTNLNAGFADTPSIVVTQDPSSGGGTLIFDTRVLGEFTSIDFEGRIIVPPNTNILINSILVEPPAGLGVDLSITILWYEL